jgi:hypothetical protein
LLVFKVHADAIVDDVEFHNAVLIGAPDASRVSMACCYFKPGQMSIRRNENG